jgi:hypothetical protein
MRRRFESLQARGGRPKPEWIRSAARRASGDHDWCSLRRPQKMEPQQLAPPVTRRNRPIQNVELKLATRPFGLVGDVARPHARTTTPTTMAARPMHIVMKSRRRSGRRRNSFPKLAPTPILVHVLLNCRPPGLGRPASHHRPPEARAGAEGSLSFFALAAFLLIRIALGILSA